MRGAPKPNGGPINDSEMTKSVWRVLRPFWELASAQTRILTQRLTMPIEYIAQIRIDGPGNVHPALPSTAGLPPFSVVLQFT